MSVRNLKLLLIVPYLAALLVGLLCTPLLNQRARAIEISSPGGVQPSTNVVFGSSGLADPGLAINTSSANQAVLGFKGNGLSDYIADSTASGYFFALGGTTRLTIGPTGNLTPSGAYVFGNGADLSETNAPRAAVCFFSPVATNVAQTWGNYAPSVNVHLRALSINLATVDATCTTTPVETIRIAGVNQATSNTTISNSTSDILTSGLSLPVTAGQRVDITLSTLSAGCGTFGLNNNSCIEYTTD